MSNVLFIQVNPWTTGKRRTVSTSHGRGGPVGWLVGWDAGLPVPVAAPLHSKPTESALEKRYLIQICCFYFIK